MLNRVTGVDPSSILGSLQSNGRVFLINPNGIVFGAGSTVDVAGMVASTLNLSNADFLAGRNHFTAIPNAANLSNAGNITTTNAGHVYLIAPNVENTGVITSPNGEILLAAGSNVDLVNSASPNLRVNITAGAGNATNMGQLVASSGSLGLFGALVKNTGVVNADGVVVQGGEVIFKASSRAEVGGTVSANGTTGGTIQALGNEVGIMNGAAITANGTQGGGTILVGGDTRGLNPAVQNAQVTYVDPNATISADAIQNGNGGKVVVWADNTTRMYGKISARGGALSGNGGFVETSGKKVLDVTSAPDVFAPNGTSGVWLLDPETINIVATASVNSTGASPFSPLAAGTSSLQNTIVNTALNAGGIVTIDTTGGSALGVGDINVNAVLSKTAGAASTLNFNAHGNVNVNSAITSTVGALNINFTPGQAGAVATTNVLAGITPNGGVVTFNKASSLVTAVGFTLGGVGGGTFVNPLGTTMVLSGTTLSGITLNNNGTVNQTGNVLLTGGAIFNNNAGANYTLNTTAAQYLYSDTTGVFNNAGTFTQVAATATNVYSYGYVAGNGQLTFNEASTGILAGTGARINMAANLTMTGNLTLQGLGLGLLGNTFTTNKTLAPTTVTGALTMVGAGNAPVMNLAGGSLTVAAGAGNTLTVAGGTITGLLNNQATLNVTGGTLGDVNNTGTLNAPAVLTLTGSYTQSGAGVLAAPAAGFTMNAGTDITLNNAISKPALSGLWTFSAGRSVALNSSVTTNNTAFTAVANSGGLNNNGTATPATLTLGAGATINAGTGVVNLAVTGGNFINNSGSATPITAANTRIYSTDPRLNNVGGMVTQSRLYLCTYAAGCGATAIPTTNTVYLYSIADPTPILTVTANALSKVYGTVDPTLTYTVTGLIGGDSATGVLSGGLSRVAGNNVGNYAINNAGLVTNGYVLAYVSNNLTITPASLVVSGLTVANKVYNGNAAATVNSAAATYTGLVAGDAVTMTNAAAFADKNAAVGKVVTFSSSAGGASAANYTIVNQAATTANITPAALNISATGVNRVYDATTAATVTLADNRIAGDVLTTGYTTAAFLDKNVAVGKTVNVSGLSLAGADATNYTFNTTAATTATITARPLTMTGLTVANKVYDGTVAATVTGGTYNNIIAGDVLTVGGLTASFADANAAVGKTVTVTGAASFTGADAGNYTITAAAPSTALANITPRPLTVLLGTTNRVYNGTTVANASGSGATLLNVVAGENVGFSAGPLVPYQFNTGFGFTTLNALATPTTSFADKNVGIGKVITLDQPLNTLVAAYSSPGPIANSVNWGGTGNYSFASITNATGNITPLAVQLSGTRVYDATLAANSAILNVANKVVGDTLTLSGGATLAGKAVGSQAVATSGTLGLAGADAPNYTLTGVTGTVAITPASLTVSGNIAANKVYDGGTVATVNSAGAVYTGIFAGDVVTVNTTGAFADKNVAAGKVVTLSSAKTGTDAGNYTITNQVATTANITAKALTVAAAGVNRVYDASTAATVTLTDNRVIGDVLTTGYTTAAFLDKNVGAGKAVNVAGITLAGVDATNYSFNTTAATTANITTKALTVAGITAVNKVYDGGTVATINTAGAIYTGLIAGDVATASAVGATGSFVDKNVGINKGVSISGMTLTGVDALNYSFNATAATTANITAKALTIAGITAANKVYDATTAATVNVAGATYTGLVAGDVLAVNATGTFADKNAAVGKTVTLTSGYTGADVANYTIINQGTTTANITAKALTVAANGINKVYDATTAATVTLADNRVAGDALTTGYTTAAFLDKNVGAGKAVNVSGISLAGVDALNYSFNAAAATTANITAKALTVAGITAANKVYDGTTAATINTAGATYTGLVAGDALAVNATGTFADKNVAFGKVVTLTSGYIGADAGNYLITGQAATTANITAKALMVAATGINKVYDATTAATVTLADNRVIGDVLTTGYTTAAFLDKNVGAGKTVNVTGITLAGVDATNYSFNTTAATTANITAKALTVGATGINKVYDATTAATVTLADNRVIGDVLTTGYTTAAFLDKNVGAGKAVNVAGITLAGADATNYSFNATAATTANITGKTLTIAGITAANKVYDATTAATVNVAAATYTGLVAGDVLAVNATGTFADKNAAVGKVVTLVNGYTGADVGNYLITGQGTTTANITAKALTVGATGINKVYDATTAATVTLADNRVIGDVLTTGYTTAAFLDKNVGVGKAVNVAGITLAGVDATNYSFNTTAATTANISGKALTIAGITAANKVYDGNTSATVSTAGATYTGLLAGDVLAVNATGTFADKNAAIGKVVTLVSGYSGVDVANYLITGQGTTTANITAKALTVGATGINKVYDATTAATVTLADNRIAGDVLTTGYTTAAFLDKNVGAGKAVNVAGITLAGVDATNYSFNATVATTANITAKALTVAATGINKMYDATAAATVTLADNRIAGDVLTTGYTTAAFLDKNVAVGKTVNVSGISLAGADALNYSFNATAATTANITGKALTVGGITTANKVYDGTTAATVNVAGATYTGLVAGDILAVNATGIFADKNAALGKVVTLTSGYTGADAGNYLITGQGTTTANITGKALTIGGITAVNKVYDGTTAATVNVAGATYTGLVAGDVLAVNATGTFADKNVAVGKTVTLLSGYTGADAGNYTITNQAATTANITAKALTVAATGINKVYDATTAATVTLADNRVAGDALTTGYTTAAFLDKNVGVGKAVNVAGISLAGVDALNYSFNTTAATTANITAKALTVAGITAANKVYDGNTSATVSTAGATYTGLVAGDVLAVSATGTFADKNAALGKTVTLASGYTGADAGNYTITNQAATTANITPASLAVAANAAGKVYGAVDPAFSYTATGLVAGDTVATVLTGAQARVAGENVGAYAINQGLLASNANYTIAYIGSNLTINAAPVATAAAPVDIVNTVLIPGNTAPGTAHSTIQTANVLNNNPASPDTVAQVDSASRAFSSAVLVCRETGVPGQGLQAVPLCVMSVR